MPTKKQKDLFVALQQFYQRPVAQVSLELFLSIGSILFFAIFAIKPTLLTMSDLLKEIADKKELEQQLTKKIAALSTVQSSYLQLQNRLYVLDEAIPNTPQLIYSLKVIEKTASELQLAITGINVAELPTEIDLENQSLDPTTLDRINLLISININGDYPTIRQFVEKLKNYRRSFVIESIVFATKEIKGDKQLNTKVTLSIPYLGISNKKTKTPKRTRP